MKISKRRANCFLDFSPFTYNVHMYGIHTRRIYVYMTFRCWLYGTTMFIFMCLLSFYVNVMSWMLFYISSFIQFQSSCWKLKFKKLVCYSWMLEMFFVAWLLVQLVGVGLVVGYTRDSGTRRGRIIYRQRKKNHIFT